MSSEHPATTSTTAYLVSGTRTAFGRYGVLRLFRLEHDKARINRPRHS